MSCTPCRAAYAVLARSGATGSSPPWWWALGPVALILGLLAVGRRS